MTDESYIKLAIEIAKKGSGYVSPNPLVGALIVKNDHIIGAGYHERFGSSHAEVNAVNNSTQDVSGSTLFVNLEPCSHFGKTPPCADLIIEKKISRVVIGTLDMNPLVSGNGVKKLKKAGISVKVGVFEKECIELNRFFFKSINKKIPYVTLKTAQTIDGKIADIKGNSKWITSYNSRKFVHQLRAEYDAVLVGSGTVRKDDPSLTVRMNEGRSPIRVILDTKLSLKTTYKVFQTNSVKRVFLITGKSSSIKKEKIKKIQKQGVTLIFVKENKNGKINIKSALTELYNLGINSVLVEGGSEIFSSFIKENLFDEIYSFISPKYLGSGLRVVGNLGINSIDKSIKLKVASFEKYDEDILIVYRKE